MTPPTQTFQVYNKLIIHFDELVNHQQMENESFMSRRKSMKNEIGSEEQTLISFCVMYEVAR